MFQTLYQTETNSLTLHNTSSPSQSTEGRRGEKLNGTARQHPRQFVTGAWVATLYNPTPFYPRQISTNTHRNFPPLCTIQISQKERDLGVIHHCDPRGRPLTRRYNRSQGREAHFTGYLPLRTAEGFFGKHPSHPQRPWSLLVVFVGFCLHCTVHQTPLDMVGYTRNINRGESHRIDLHCIPKK